MKKNIKKTEGTQRLEAFSDSVFAFCVTLLVIDIKVPMFSGNLNDAVMAAILQQWPKFLIFVLSFMIIAILWVNHHHFVENFKYTDWKLLWYNNFLLFWVVLIPFATDFIGEHPYAPLVVAMYSWIMFMVGLSFLLMVRYVFFKSELLDVNIPDRLRKEEFGHTFPAVALYGIATLLAFVKFEISLVILILVPALYFIPSVLHREKGFMDDI